MHYFIYPTKDVAIYSKFPDYNYGLDEILEIRKEVTDITGYYWNSRILMQFNTSSFSPAAIASASNFYINLYAANPLMLSSDYTIEAYPVSQSWDQGTGFPGASSVHKDGASWSKRLRNVDWLNSGSDYITSSAATQTFSFEAPDIRMDITNIVRQWISGTLPNYGIVIKFLDAEEQDSSSYGRLTFYSKDTHTVNLPTLEAVWDDSTFVTGSSQLITSGTVQGTLQLGGTVSTNVLGSGSVSGTLSGITGAAVQGYISGAFGGAFVRYASSILSSSLSQNISNDFIGILSGSYIGSITGSTSGTIASDYATGSYFSGSITGTGTLTGSYNGPISGSIFGSVIGQGIFYTSGSINSYISGTINGFFVGTSSNASIYYYETGTISSTNSGSVAGGFSGNLAGTASTISGSVQGIFIVAGTTIGTTVISGSFTNYLAGITFQALTNDQISIVFKNLKKEYKYGTSARFRIFGKDQYQRKTFLNTAATAFNIIKYLPQNATYYSIVDAYTGRIIIPFDNFSKVSCDTDGNFFDVNLNGFMPERFYKIIFKSTFSGVDNYFDKNYIFKVVK